MTARIVLALLLGLAVALGISAWNNHLIARGDAQGAQRVRVEWATAEAKRLADEAQARMRDQAARQKETKRIANEQAQRDEALRSAVAAAGARERGLLATIARLNAAARVPGAGADTGAASGADAASIARAALGECSSRYAALGGVADGLADQVIGLQDYVRTVVLAGSGEQ